MRKFLIIFLLISTLTACFKKNVVNYVDDPDLLYNQAISLYKRGKYEKAAKDFLEFKNRYPLDHRIIEVSIKYADSLYKAKEYIEAEEAYLEFIRMHPKNKLVPYCYYQLGMCEFKQISTIDRDQSKVVSAYKYFRDVVEKFPNTRFAVVANHRILECRRKIAKYNFYVGYFYYKQQRFNAAIYRFKKVLRLYPGFIDDKVLFYLGKCYMDKKEPYKAKLIFEKLIKEFPQSRYRFEAKNLLKNLKPEKFTIWRRIVDYFFRFESDVGDKYYTPGYKTHAYPPALNLEKILSSLSKEKRTIITLKSAPEIKKQYVKAEKESKKTTEVDKTPVNISANSVKYLKNGQEVLFEGNVVASRGDFTLKCDKILAYLDTTKKKIRKIEATGNVEIIYLTKFAKAKKVIYNVPENKIILTGNPEIRDLKNVVKGQKIIYFLKTQQIFVQGTMKKRGEIILTPKK